MVNDVKLHTDKTKEISTALPRAPVAASEKHPNLLETLEQEIDIANATTPGKRSFISAGEHIHKWGTYLSVDWVLNAATGVTFSYLSKYTELGRKLWNDPIHNGFSRVLKPFIKSPKQLNKSAGIGTIFVSVITGGMFTIPPLMLLENNKIKRSITHFFDGFIYGKEKIEQDPKFQQAYEEIEQTPKKDFLNGMLSRFAALAPLLAIVLIPPTKKIADIVWFNHVEKASGAVANKLGFSIEKSFKNVSPAEAEERWNYIHQSMAIDFGLGIPYAILHSYFYNWFSSKKKKEDSAPAISEPSPIMTETKAETAIQRVAKPAALYTQKLHETEALSHSLH